MSTDPSRVTELPVHAVPDPEAVTAKPGTWHSAGRAVRAVRWSAVALAVALIGVEAVTAAESFGGLVGFAHLIGIHGSAAYGVPVTLDGVSLVAALMALRAELAGESSAMPRFWLYAFTAASASANWWHGQHADGTPTALYYGGVSLAVTIMFALVLRGLRAEDRRHASLVAERLPKFSGPLWARYPGLAFRAWSLAVLHGYRTPREAVDAALAAKLAAELPALELDAEALAALTPRDRLVVAFGAVGAIDVPRALALLDRHGAPVDQSHAYQIRKAITAGREGGER
jgi:hypothetical protein